MTGGVYVWGNVHLYEARVSSAFECTNACCVYTWRRVSQWKGMLICFSHVVVLNLSEENWWGLSNCVWAFNSVVLHARSAPVLKQHLVTALSFVHFMGSGWVMDEWSRSNRENWAIIADSGTDLTTSIPLHVEVLILLLPNQKLSAILARFKCFLQRGNKYFLIMDTIINRNVIQQNAYLKLRVLSALHLDSHHKI